VSTPVPGCVLKGTHADGYCYCSKLYARPLGWGTVRIETKALLLLDTADGKPVLRPEGDIQGWVTRNPLPGLPHTQWLDAHRHKHPDAADYPKESDKKTGKPQIYTFHTGLRAEHALARRHRKRTRR
jgi:hypothetical protein